MIISIIQKTCSFIAGFFLQFPINVKFNDTHSPNIQIVSRMFQNKKLKVTISFFDSHFSHTIIICSFISRYFLCNFHASVKSNGTYRPNSNTFKGIKPNQKTYNTECVGFLLCVDCAHYHHI